MYLKINNLDVEINSNSDINRDRIKQKSKIPITGIFNGLKILL
jgi:hypothetical protein